MAVGTLPTPGTEMELIGTSSALSSTVQSFACDWKKYKIIIVNVCFFANVLATAIRPLADFAASTASNRILLTTTTAPNANHFSVQCYAGDDTHAAASMVSGSQANIYVRVYGIR